MPEPGTRLAGMYAALAALVGVAALTLPRLPMLLHPAAALPRLVVTATLSGAGPAATEALLTAPLEGVAQQVGGVMGVESVSEARDGVGEARVEVRFAPGADLRFARLELSERIEALRPELPAGTSPPRIAPVGAASEPGEPGDADALLVLALTGHAPYEVLRALAEEQLAPELRQIPGVAAVRVRAPPPARYRVELDPRPLEGAALGPGELATQLLAWNASSPAGTELRDGAERPLLVEGRGRDADELARLPVTRANEPPAALARVSHARREVPEPLTQLRIDGAAAVELEVAAASATRQPALAEHIARRLAMLRGRLPNGMRLLVESDASADLRALLVAVARIAVASLLLMLLALGVRLRSAGAALLVAAGIITSLAAVVVAGGLLRQPLSAFTLTGLAIVAAGATRRACAAAEGCLGAAAPGVAPSHARTHGGAAAAEVGGLVTALLLLPLLRLPGGEGVLFAPLLRVVVGGSAASYLVGRCCLPPLARRWVGTGAARRVASQARGPARQLNSPRWWGAALAALVLAACAIAARRYLPFTLFRVSTDEPDSVLHVEARLAPGSDPAITSALARQVEAALLARDGAQRVTLRTSAEGADVRADFPHAALRAGQPWRARARADQVARETGGARLTVMGFGAPSSNAGNAAPAYTLRLTGYSYSRVAELAGEVADRLRRFHRVAEIEVDAGSGTDPPPGSEAVLQPDRSALADAGLTVAQLAGQIHDRLVPVPAGTIRLAGEDLPVTLGSAEGEVPSAERMAELAVPTAEGGELRVRDLASLRVERAPGRITRRDQVYQRQVSWDFHGPPRLGERVQAAVVHAMALPPGYTLRAPDPARAADPEVRHFWWAAAACVALLGAGLTVALDSVAGAACVLALVAAQAAGALVAHLAAGDSFTRGSLLGVAVAAGFAAEVGIGIVRGSIERRSRRRDQAALDAIPTRSHATALALFIAAAPLLPRITGIPAEAQHAALSVLGGVIATEMLSVTLLPALLSWLRQRPLRPAEVSGRLAGSSGGAGSGQQAARSRARLRPAGSRARPSGDPLIAGR